MANWGGLIAVTWLLALGAVAAEPGLVGEYFRFAEGPQDEAAMAGEKPFYVSVDKQINFKATTGVFGASKLTERFLVRWTGSLRIEKAGVYEFSTESDDGSRLYVNDEKVVENWGPHGMETVTGTIELPEGKHAFRVSYQELGGDAGCIVRWRPPGGKWAVLPAANLSHTNDQLVAFDDKAWRAAKTKPAASSRVGGQQYNLQAFGPFQRTAVALGEHAGTNNWQAMEKENTVYRGIVIPLSDAAEAGVVFDADTMRMAAGWTAGGMSFQGLPFTGAHAPFPSHNGERIWTMAAAPGWGKSGVIADPRPGDYPALGNLPKDWAHYQGLYRHDDRVVLSYLVGAVEVLESPSLEDGLLVRNFELGAHGAMTIVLADAGDGAEGGAVGLLPDEAGTTLVGAKGAPDGSTFDLQDGRLVFRLAAGKGGPFRLAFWRGADVAVGQQALATVAEPASLQPLTQPAGRLWPEVAVTQGEIGKDEAAYVVDRITVPYKNPWNRKMRIGGMDFFSDGTTAAVSTWDGDVFIVKGIDGDLDALTWSRFASGGHECLGLKIVDDVIYTVSDAEITRYHDLNDDGEADYYENLNSDWDLTSGFHAFCFDLHANKDGDFFFGFGAPVRNGGSSFMRLGRHHGSVLQVSADGSQMTRYATGFRAPNGIGLGPDGQVTTGDNEGTFVPRSPLNWVAKNSFNGVIDTAANPDQFKTTATVAAVNGGRSKALDASEMPQPFCWLPKSVDNSGGGQVWVTGERWGPLQGALLHMSYGKSALYLAMPDKKGNKLQGGVARIPVKFASSCMRARMNPGDGQLYVAGLRGWQTNAAKDGGFDRVRYTGKSVLMPVGLKTSATGIELTFAVPLDAELANDPTSYSVRGADILWSQGYGSQEYQLGNRGGKMVKGWTSLKVTGAKLQPDGKTVRIEVDGMQPAHMMEISVDLETTDGELIIAKVHNTIHEL